MKRHRAVKVMEAACLQAETPRTILLVDNDAFHVEALRSAWSQLRLSDELHVAGDHENALRFLRRAAKDKKAGRVAAIVLDPNATGEETGAFLREVRSNYARHVAPVLLWTRDRRKYGVLEGQNVISVLQKTMVLKVIASLDEACRLRMHRFTPFLGGIMIR